MRIREALGLLCHGPVPVSADRLLSWPIPDAEMLEGLPELAPGSRWHGHVVVDYLDDTCWADEDVIRLSGDTNSYIQDVRAVIARHDRGNGEYWRDRLRELASVMLVEADEYGSEITRDAAHRILAVLDEVPA